MKLDNDKIDNAVLALLLLGLHDGTRAWKGFDWDSMNRLHTKGFISDPRGKAKSIVFTEEGLRQAERLLEELFFEHDGAADQPSELVYAIVRYNRFQEPSEDSFTVKEVVRTQAIAEAEVNRLNELNADKNCAYSWQVTRLFTEGEAAGNRGGENP
jgi:Domain of unknown function (DUF6429)